jgi:hypothetical protein
MSQEEIRLDRHFIAVWRAKWLIIIVVLSASAVAWWLARQQPTLHSARGLVKIGRVWKEPLEDPFITEMAVNSAGFFRELAGKTGGNPSHLKRRILAEVVIAGTNKARYPILLSITSSDENAVEAVRLAQSVTDEIIERHEKLFDQALVPYLQREQLLESQLKEFQASRELGAKLELELNEVKSNNSSAMATEKTHLLEPIVADATTRPGGWRGVATVALVSALISIAVAVLIGHFKTP